MSRYYDIRISDPVTGQVIVPAPMKQFNTGTSYTNYINGQMIAGGLDIELQIRNFFYGSHQGVAKDGSFVTIHGVSIPEISRQLDLNGMNIVVKAGMQKGLPLAKPDQNGVLATGRIWQALGNWEGVDKHLTLMIYGSPQMKLRNFQFVWRKGTKLADAIQTTLATGLPECVPDIHISDSLVNGLSKDITGSWGTFEAFAAAMHAMSLDPQYGGFTTINGMPYSGIRMTIRPTTPVKVTAGQMSFPLPGGGSGPAPAPSSAGVPGGTVSTTATAPGGQNNKAILVVDMTKFYQETRSPSRPIILAYEDFIGQPSWISPMIVRFKTVMRADIRVADFVKFPNTPFGNLFFIASPDAAIPNSPSRNKLAFQSTYIIRRVTHYGRLRQPDASSWVSTYEAVFTSSDLNKSTPIGQDPKVIAAFNNPAPFGP
jgi:hypothetical protein